ncbi:MAG: PAS domain-containing protein, partial [Xanthomonadales bacterium]|nr:PAS domain-containing protein [Xanthomonadales bacterium]
SHSEILGGGMPRSTLRSKKSADFQLKELRSDAEGRLEQGTAPQNNSWSLGTDALTLLYQLAANPDTASDALKLLHELQVHQVELDLQQGQLKSVEDEAAWALSRYQAFYEFAPVAYFALSLDGLIIEANRAGERLLGFNRDDLRDQPILSYLAPASQAEVISLFDRLRAGATDSSCQVKSAPGTSGPDTLRLTACVPPHQAIVLMTVTGPG